MYSDEEIKADILNRLMRRGCWGGKYIPLESLINWLSKKVKRNGKRVRRLIKSLIKEKYILVHKGGKTISLNPALNKEIIKYIAVYQGKIVGIGEEKGELARKVYKKYGYVPIYIEKISKEEINMEVPSPELNTYEV